MKVQEAKKAVWQGLKDRRLALTITQRRRLLEEFFKTVGLKHAYDQAEVDSFLKRVGA